MKNKDKTEITCTKFEFSVGIRTHWVNNRLDAATSI